MVEFELWWLLLIPFFFGLGWIAARIDIKHIISETTDLPASYFKGLNYILFQDYEKASECFSDAIRIKPDSLELHFILGNIFRKLGKIDQAINLHNKLLEQKELTPQQIESVKAELMQDYFTAGFYDRCETISTEILNEQYQEFKLKILLDISIKQRNWESAIKYGKEVEQNFGTSYRLQISHFLCELALEKIINEKKYGEILNFRCLYGKSKIVTYEASEWRSKKKYAGGGILIDQGIHLLDILLFFNG